MKDRKFRLNIGKKFLTVRVVRYWDRLPRKVMYSSTLVGIKARVDKALNN